MVKKVRSFLFRIAFCNKKFKKYPIYDEFSLKRKPLSELLSNDIAFNIVFLFDLFI